MTRILLVEDEVNMARALKQGLEEESYLVDHVPTSKAALVHLKITTYDLAIVDRRLPDLTGIELLRRLRESGSTLPCLMLTACDAGTEIIEGLDAGADDYVTKPVRFEILLARIRALLRRSTSAGSQPVLRCDDLALDPASQRVHRGSRELSLSKLEWRLLEHLLRHVGEVQSRERIAMALWPEGREPNSNVLEVLIGHLRKKIDGDAENKLLHTRRGQGYLLSLTL